VVVGADLLLLERVFVGKADASNGAEELERLGLFVLLDAFLQSLLVASVFLDRIRGFGV